MTIAELLYWRKVTYGREERRQICGNISPRLQRDANLHYRDMLREDRIHSEYFLGEPFRSESKTISLTDHVMGEERDRRMNDYSP